MEKVASQEALRKDRDDNAPKEVIVNKPVIYVGDQLIEEWHYMHVTYPIFMKVDKPTPGFILAAVGMRINGEVRIFSPFFANQP